MNNRILIVFVLTSFLTNAQVKDSTMVSVTSEFIDPISLGKFNPTNDTLHLTIESRYDECGEWGGHYEKTTVRSDSTGIIKAYYEKYGINCDSIYFYNRKEEFNIEPIFTKKIHLDEQKIIALKKFSLELLQASFSERNQGHSGKYFRIRYWDNFDINYTDYFSLQGFDNTYEEFLEALEFK